MSDRPVGTSVEQERVAAAASASVGQPREARIAKPPAGSARRRRHRARRLDPVRVRPEGRHGRRPRRRHRPDLPGRRQDHPARAGPERRGAAARHGEVRGRGDRPAGADQPCVRYPSRPEQNVLTASNGPNSAGAAAKDDDPLQSRKLAQATEGVGPDVAPAPMVRITPPKPAEEEAKPVQVEERRSAHKADGPDARPDQARHRRIGGCRQGQSEAASVIADPGPPRRRPRAGSYACREADSDPAARPRRPPRPDADAPDRPKPPTGPGTDIATRAPARRSPFPPTLGGRSPQLRGSEAPALNGGGLRMKIGTGAAGSATDPDYAVQSATRSAVGSASGRLDQCRRSRRGGAGPLGAPARHPSDGPERRLDAGPVPHHRAARRRDGEERRGSRMPGHRACGRSAATRVMCRSG